MKLAVSRLMAGLMVAGIFGFGTMMQSCSSQSSSPLASDVNSSSQLVNANTTSDFNEYLNYADTYTNLNIEIAALGDPNADSTKGGPGGGGRDTTGGKGGPGNGGGNTGKGGPRFRPLPFPCLGLDSAQMALVRQFMKEAADANKAANEAFRTATAPLRDQQKAAMEAFRTATADVRQKLEAAAKEYRAKAQQIITDGKAAGKTREEIAAELKALRDEFQSATADLRAQMDAARKALDEAMKGIREQMAAAQKTLQLALEANQKMLNDKIYGILTDAQKAIWDQWLAGKDPCKGIGPRK